MQVEKFMMPLLKQRNVLASLGAFVVAIQDVPLPWFGIDLVGILLAGGCTSPEDENVKNLDGLLPVSLVMPTRCR